MPVHDGAGRGGRGGGAGGGGGGAGKGGEDGGVVDRPYSPPCFLVLPVELLRHSFHPGPTNLTGRGSAPSQYRSCFERDSDGSTRKFIREAKAQAKIKACNWKIRESRSAGQGHAELYRIFVKMCNWSWLLALCHLVTIGNALSASLMEDVKSADQAMRAKPKRAQEMLMFGNQQNRQTENSNNAYAPSLTEKRTLSASGLSGLKNALGEEDRYPASHSKTPSNALYDRDGSVPYERNYEYAKVLVNDLNNEEPRSWDLPQTYPRYYISEDRRKRSEKPTQMPRRMTTTVSPPSTSTTFQVPMPTQQPAQVAQVKRSVPIYAEPRYKRDLDIDPEDVLTLLSLWENERRNRNWRKYANDEYENIDDDASLIDVEDPRNAIQWGDGPIYPTHRYAGADSLAPSEIGIIRTHPPNYYEQYGNQYDQQQYDGDLPYDGSEYNSPYPQHTYYPGKKRFMVTRKRSQIYDPYLSAAQLHVNSQQPRSYNNYQRRLVY